jgi:hypothetical protein
MNSKVLPVAQSQSQHHDRKMQEAPSNSCHGLLWTGEDVLGTYFFSLSMQKCGRNLMLVSQKDDPRL